MPMELDRETQDRSRLHVISASDSFREGLGFRGSSFQAIRILQVKVLWVSEMKARISYPCRDNPAA